MSGILLYLYGKDKKILKFVFSCICIILRFWLIDINSKMEQKWYEQIMENDNYVEVIADIDKYLENAKNLENKEKLKSYKFKIENVKIINDCIERKEYNDAIKNIDLYLAKEKDEKTKNDLILLKQNLEKLLKAEFISKCEIIDYNKIERTPHVYKEKLIKFSGKVTQVVENESLWGADSTILLVNSNGNSWYVTYYRMDLNESRILEGDYITIYGTCEGVKSYDTISGVRVTKPSAVAKYIKNNYNNF